MIVVTTISEKSISFRTLVGVEICKKRCALGKFCQNNELSNAPFYVFIYF